MSRKKELFIKAAAKFGTPILVYDSSVFQSCYSNLREALPPCVDIFYALKVNPNLSLVKILSALGLNAEVCSLAELEVAMKAGVKPTYFLSLLSQKRSYKEFQIWRVKWVGDRLTSELKKRAHVSCE